MPNRLAGETSPYLLQHADNPVDWYPWGEEALGRARELDRPILLSIGYSACHWCHVMERESFEDEATAALMNASFVNVKVDREERPDLDGIYMRAVQALTGRGGWPMTVFLTPEGVPYYGGTYFPPEPRFGMPSFRQVLEATRDAWAQRRDEVARSAGELLGALRRAAASRPAAGDGVLPGPESVAGALRTLEGAFDDRNGGFGSGPKFPQAPTLELLLRIHRAASAGVLDGAVGRRASEMVLLTLRSMARGGIRDHLGGGFHRYSVDGRWLVPHFEKMLYDNALLARLYVQAWQVTGDAAFREVAESTLDWMLADMRDPAGGFYSARDADSEGEEGRYYVWTPSELRDVLDPDDAALVARTYDVTDAGNFEGRSILHLPHDLAAVARREAADPGALARRLADARKRLLEVRSRRVPPFRDEKVLAGWNGLALRALTEAGGAMGRDDWVEAGRRGLQFLLGEMRSDGRLLRTWREGDARIPAFLEDHAAVGNALLTAWEVTMDPAWLPEIRWACEAVVERFWADEEGVFHDTDEEAETLVVRPREVMDNATPSGTSLAAELLLRAGHLFGESSWLGVTRRVLAREAPLALGHPSSFGRLLSLLVQEQETPVEIALIGPRGDPATRALHRTALRPFLPGRTLAGRAPGETLPVSIPVLEGREARDGRPTAFVCRELTCREPVTTPEALDRQLQQV